MPRRRACSNSARAKATDYPFRLAVIGTERKSPPRRDRRLGSGRLLRGRARAQARGNARRGRHVRPPADAVRARARRRRAGPSEDQVGDPRLREDGGAPELPLLRQCRGRPRRLGRRTSRSATTRSSSRYGAATDRQLGIPGEDLPGSHAATDFVGWYNAHPDFADREFDLSCERVVVIGNGNVAIDVARMLALTPRSCARPTPPTTRSRRSTAPASRRSSSSAAAAPRRRPSRTPSSASSARWTRPT